MRKKNYNRNIKIYKDFYDFIVLKFVLKEILNAELTFEKLKKVCKPNPHLPRIDFTVGY